MVARIVSAMLKLVGLHFFQDVPTGLGRFLSPPNGFSPFLHDFRPFLVAFSSLPKITPHVTQGCAQLCTNATKKTFKIGTPFSIVHLYFCERVRPMALIWDRFRIKVIGRAPVLGIALQKHAGHFTTFGHMAPQACVKC